MALRNAAEILAVMGRLDEVIKSATSFELLATSKEAKRQIGDNAISDKSNPVVWLNAEC